MAVRTRADGESAMALVRMAAHYIVWRTPAFNKEKVTVTARARGPSQPERYHESMPCILSDVDRDCIYTKEKVMNGYDNISNRYRPKPIATAALFLSLTVSATASPQTLSEGIQRMSPQSTSVAQYDEQVGYFKPEQGLATINGNDLRLFIYEWFTHFEHASDVSFYLSHFDDKNMSATFPGAAPITSHADFARWYGNLLAQALLEFSRYLRDPD
jgi:hypothetical protein